MKCLQVISLTDKYLERKLKLEECELFEKHVDICPNCKEQLWTKKRLWDALSSIKTINTPTNFTENVMESIMALNIERHQHIINNAKTVYAPVFRRLGISMILTAAVMLFSLQIPMEIYQHIRFIDISPDQSMSQNSNEITDVFYKVDGVFKNFLGNINNSIQKFKEV